MASPKSYNNSGNLAVGLAHVGCPWYRKLMLLGSQRFQIQREAGAGRTVVLILRARFGRMFLTDLYVLDTSVAPDILSQIPPHAYAHA